MKMSVSQTTEAASSNQRGFSLVELMVAITVGLILMTGVVQMFLSSKTVFSTQQGISRIQETGRLAMEFLSRDIREAGYMGCQSRYNPISYFSTLNDPDEFLVDFQTGIEAAIVPPAALGETSHLEGTPILIVRTANGTGAHLVEENNPADLSMTIENTGQTGDGCWSGVCPDDILVIADCAKARVFQAREVTGSSGSSTVDIGHGQGGNNPGNRLSSWGNSPTAQFEEGGEVIKIRTLAYYVGENAQERPALYLKEGFNDPVELLEGVENINFQFGMDTNADSRVDEYVDITAVGNWDNVLAVRVELLVQSADDNVSPEEQTYDFAGEEGIEPGDRRIRQVFTSTVGIRTRLN